MDIGDKHILLYDGHCLMCSGLVRWVMDRDKAGKIHFGALQDPDVEPLLKKAPDHIRTADSVVLYSRGRFSYRSTAILRLLKLLGFPWNITVILFVIPPFIRDAVYKVIAKYRTRWFGRNESCFFVPPEKRSRFLTDPGKEFDGKE